jgi:CheY-like chemotaxis protein
MAQGKPRILVVDDESDVLLFLFDVLSSSGFRVDGSSSAPDALGYIARRIPDLVLADVRMPGMDGLELLERIKRVAPQTRVLLLGTFADPAKRQEALDLGALGLLEKTISPAALVRAVERVVGEIAPLREPEDRNPAHPE